MKMPDLITVEILKEDGAIIAKEIIFKENSDNAFALDEFVDFITDNQGNFEISVTHYNEK